MKAAQLDKLIRSLGQRRDQILIQDLDIHSPREERFTAGEWFDIDVEPGVVMEFKVKTQIFEALYICFFDDVSDDFEYAGELPQPFKFGGAQSEVRAVFGAPDESQGPIKIPDPIGEIGGWDIYYMNPELYPNATMIFKYSESLEVCDLSFKYVSSAS